MSIAHYRYHHDYTHYGEWHQLWVQGHDMLNFEEKNRWGETHTPPPSLWSGLYWENPDGLVGRGGGALRV